MSGGNWQKLCQQLNDAEYWSHILNIFKKPEILELEWGLRPKLSPNSGSSSNSQSSLVIF